MAKQAIDLIDLMKTAHKRKREVSASEFHTKAKNLLSYAYVEYKNMYIDYCNSKGEEYKNRIFYIFQHIFAYLMMSDGEATRAEHECYSLFCNYAKVEPLTIDDCRALYNRLETDEVIDDIKFLRDLRPHLKDADNYRAMVQGFCYFCLASNKKLDEIQYLLLSFFFESNIDSCPSNWTMYKLKTLFI